jgi:hypothetical protein
MQFLALLMIVVSLTFDYLKKIGVLPGLAPYMVELTSAIALLYVIAAGVRTRFRYIRAGYWLFFAVFATVIVCGIITNAVGAGPLFAGIRTYVRPLPLFFLPAVFLYDQKKIKTQLMLILAIALFQVPLALYQRFSKFTDTFQSGDLTVGTLTNSAILSIFQICVACVLIGFFLRKRIRLVWFIPLFLLVLVPTTVNETKGTLFLLPLGLMTVFLAGAPRGARLRYVVLAVGLLAVFGAIFVPVYDYFVKPRWGYGIVEFFTMEGRVEGYLEKKNADVGMTKEAGRVDAVMIPLREIAKDPAHLVFGLGIGNASNSALGLQFTGYYFRLFEPFMISSVSRFLMEIGLLGFALTLVFFLMIFNDARVVATVDKGLLGAMALGWTGVVATMALANFYKDPVAYGSMSLLFWYFSGLIAAQRVRLALQKDTVAESSAQRAPAYGRKSAIA